MLGNFWHVLLISGYPDIFNSIIYQQKPFFFVPICSQVNLMKGGHITHHEVLKLRRE